MSADYVDARVESARACAELWCRHACQLSPRVRRRPIHAERVAGVAFATPIAACYVQAAAERAHGRTAERRRHGAAVFPLVGDRIVALHTGQKLAVIAAAHSVHVRVERDEAEIGARHVQTG